MVMVKRSRLPLLAALALLGACRSSSDNAGASATPSTPGLSDEEVLAGFDAADKTSDIDAEPVAVPETEPLDEE